MNGLFLKNRLNHGFRGLMDFTDYLFTDYFFCALLLWLFLFLCNNTGISEEERGIEVT
jgi:hypothetical protein